MSLRQLLFITAISSIVISCKGKPADYKPLDRERLAREYFQEDAQWYMDNIPFFECSDKQIEQVYYYRWKMYKAHIRNVGENQFVITEFINDMGWDRDPYSTINAATMHHIYEGRWLRDSRYIDGYIDYMYHNGGNNRQYSESIADASYANYLVNADKEFLIAQLDSMKHQFEGWYDHYDSSKHLYYIPAMPDATEYTIASIDASGGKDGFDGGDAFRPTINSYMYGNALAIARIAAMKGDEATSRLYQQRAMELRTNVLRDLWNDSLQHFTDRHQVTNKYVRYWDFIRGRELAGMAPWYFNLPDEDPKYNAAWKHITDTNFLQGPFGLRTNEPSYQYYFTQFTYSFGLRGSQWNGPSWPYQSSQALHSMANFLNDYKQDVVTNSDYLKVLRLFTRQHYLPDGRIDLVENYDPDKGGPIVHFYWSNHYNHSSYNDLVISGLCGIRPSAGDSLTINPLVDSSIHYFRLEDVAYHGHRLSILYDQDGSRYGFGKGLTAFVDGKLSELVKTDKGYRLKIGPALQVKKEGRSPDLALNIWKKGFPTPSASVNNVTDSVFQAIDGKVWYFPEISNGWTTRSSTEKADWYALEFGKEQAITSAKIYLVADGKEYAVPDSIGIEVRKGTSWLPVKAMPSGTGELRGNTVNEFRFDSVSTEGMRFVFHHALKQVAVSEVEVY